MSTGIRLIPLKCIQCETPLPVEVDEVAWRCETCGTGQMLSDEGKLLPLEIHFAANDKGTNWLPFWVFAGTVTITQRQTQSGRGKGFDWSNIQRFWLPAYALDLRQAQKIAAQLTQTQPTFTTVSPTLGAAVRGCVVLPQDARKLTEFIVLSLEAAQPDWLRQLDFNLELGQPTLWLLPG